MDERRARIYDDLRGLVVGELYFEPLDRAPYAHDASLYEIDPLGVIVPRTEDDVATVVRYAAEHRIPLHARGAGTDTGGGALGAGLVIDFSRHLRKVVQITADRVVVEPGVVLETLNAELAPLGRRLEPVPVNARIGTIGGMISVDAAGLRSMRFGSMGDQVEQLRVVFAQGEIADLGFRPWPAYDEEPDTFTDLIVRKLHNVYRQSQKRLAQLHAHHAPQPCRLCARSGRGCEGNQPGPAGQRLRGHAGTRPAGGSEDRRPAGGSRGRGAPFRPAGGCRHRAQECLGSELEPSVCDLYDWRLLSLARDADPRFRAWIDEAAESVLIVEFESDRPEEVAGKIRLLIERMTREGLLKAEPVTVFRRADCERCWRCAA